MTQEEGQYDTESIGQELRLSLSEVVESIPECSMRPTEIARKINVSRVMLSRMLSALRKEHTIELLTSIPGPESLKTLIRVASMAGVEQQKVSRASSAVNRFESMLKGKYGTRAAFNAALSVSQAKSKEKFEVASRYQVYKGMSQILGVECKKWITGIVISPCSTTPSNAILLSYQASIGMRRIRPDMPVLLEFYRPTKHNYGKGPTQKMTPPNFSSYCSNPRAVMREFQKNGRSITTFSPDTLQDKTMCFDICVGSHVKVDDYLEIKNGFGKRGRSVMPAIPSAGLVSDIIIHKSFCSRLNIDLKVYTTLSKGIAVIDDESRINDIVDSQDTYEHINYAKGCIDIAEMPLYSKMVDDLCETNGYSIDEYHIYRLQVQYPLYGFQYLASFEMIQ